MIGRATMLCDLACPSCRAPLAYTAPDRRRCESCGVTYPCEGGIWRLLSPEREAALQNFIEEYESVRAAEGRRVDGPEQLLALPFWHSSPDRRPEWRIRSRTYAELIRRVVMPLERTRGGPLRILDLGSGLGWLSYRLALRGHKMRAVDLVINDFDGLGVHHQYPVNFSAVQAEFDRLPFPDASADLVIYNASFHYSVDFLSTLREGLRVLAPPGRLVIMDSPVYHDAASGRAMLRERRDAFERQHNFRGSALDGEGFLTFDRLTTLEKRLSLSLAIFVPCYGLRWSLRPWAARLLGRREPAHFALLVYSRAPQ